ncbi:MAG: hypothetical protein IJW22_07610, partial [Clostridia bacterium]|nr:hypothetical protein [Clostridia bacterium]
VGASGLTLTSVGVAETEQYFMLDGVRVAEDAADFLSGLMPGEQITVQLCVENHSTVAVAMSLHMTAPTEENDTPYVEDGRYHYFGSQIRFLSIKQGAIDRLQPSGTDAYLLTLNDAMYTNGLPPTGIDVEYDFSTLSDKALTGDIEIEAGATLTLDLTFEFVENNTSQNPYIHFGNTAAGDAEKSALVLSRELICAFTLLD